MRLLLTTDLHLNLWEIRSPWHFITSTMLWKLHSKYNAGCIRKNGRLHRSKCGLGFTQGQHSYRLNQNLNVIQATQPLPHPSESCPPGMEGRSYFPRSRQTCCAKNCQQVCSF